MMIAARQIGMISFAGVSSVNGQSGAAVVDLNSAAAAGATPYQLAIEDPHTLKFTRSVLNPAASDMFHFEVAGVRSGYANEGGELRARPAAAGRVSFRAQSNVTDDGTTQHIAEVTKSDNTVNFYADAAGNVQSGTGTAGSATTTGSWGAWTDLAGGQFAANAGQGTPTFQTRTAPGGRIELRGQIAISGSIIGGTTILTFPVVPDRAVALTERFAGTGAAAAVFSIDTSGHLTCSANLVSTDTFTFDGLAYTH